MKKKLWSFVVSSAVLTTAFAACLPGISSAKDTHKAVTITVGMWPVDSDVAGQVVWKAYQKQMKAKYPYITLKPETYVYNPDTFFPKAASGQLPTIYDTYFTEASKIIPAGYAKDITSYMKKYGYDKAIQPTVAKIFMKDGKYYGIPSSGYALGLYMNINLFKKAGLVDKNGLPIYPKTFDELAKDAVKIKQKCGVAGMFIPTDQHVGGWHFTQIAWNYGAQFEKKENGKWVSGLNSPAVVKALQYVKDLKWKYNVLLPNALLSWNDWIKYFGTEQVGMVLAAPDALINPVRDYKLDRNKIAMAPVPSGTPGNQYSLLGGHEYVLAPNATSDQVDAVFKLMDVIGNSPKVDKSVLSGLEQNLKDRSKAKTGEIVGLNSFPMWVNKDRVDAEEALNKKYRNVNYNAFKPYYDGAYKSVKAEEPYYTQDLYGILDNCLQQVLTKKNANPKDILDAASKQFQTQFLDKLK